jgi:hypothetical protein
VRPNLLGAVRKFFYKAPLLYLHTTDQAGVAGFSVQAMAGGEGFYSPEIEVEFRALAPFRQSQVDVNKNLNNGFRMMNRRPVAVEDLVPMASVVFDGKEVLMLHADSRMDFDLSQPTRSVRGRYGILPSAYQNGNESDGAEFVIDHVAPNGEIHTLFRRFLDPKNRAEDRPVQEFVIDLPADAAGRLAFRTLGGPRGNTSFDWAFWTDLEFR